MNATEMGRRSDSLYYDNVSRRELCDRIAHLESDLEDAKAENAKLREQVERLQPKDCEGNVLDIADTVNMLRSEYDGDHEWDDVVVELALTKWGGDRWIVRGSKGEAWACECTRTGHDDDAYESSSDVEPLDDATLIEVENVKLRELLLDVADVLEEHTKLRELAERLRSAVSDGADNARDVFAENAKLRKLLLDVWNDAMQFDGFWDYVHDDGEIYNEDELPHYQERMRELGIEVDA